MRYFNSTKPKGKRGYTLLFAVIVSTVVLAIAAFILSISRKQLVLASAARDSINAFYAADSGTECAVFYSSTNDLLSTSTLIAGTTITCNNVTTNVIPTTNSSLYSDYQDPAGSASNDHATSTFFMRIGNTSACAWVKIGFDKAVSGDVTYTIESRGYNIGWDSANNDCRITGPRKVERALRLTYQ